ncbi:MAG: A/G-specific adenine glycosylase [Rubrivivax sp.]|nr:A/G-specific adenine glycosylase [Rubrivivax sp.]
MTRPAATTLAARVIRWQRRHGRHGLPWQGTRDPYRVWLSEVMLQQTQVATVLDYYPRFLARFPTVLALAAAPLDDVLALWSGLGYYSRARHLHRCAQAVVAERGGAFPACSAALAQLPGVGRSTAAAIAAFCYGERAAILDGNVKRVLTRVLGFDGDLALAAEERRLWAAAEALLPVRDVDVYTQGLMDLGATLCLARTPACERCPLAVDCAAGAAGTPHLFPVKTRRGKRGQRVNAWLWLRQREQLYLVQRPPRGVWAGLWSLPQFDSGQALEEACSGWPGRGEWWPAIAHALTHFDWTLHTLDWQLPPRAKLPAALPQGRWVTPEEALAMGLPAPLRRLLGG